MNTRGKLVLVGLPALICLAVVTVGALTYFFAPRRSAQFLARVENVPLEQALLVSCDAEQGQCFVAQPVETEFGLALPYIGSPPSSATSFLWLARDGQGVLRAFVAQHPDKPCAVGFARDKHRFEDPCYGSRFAMDGSYVFGPASRGLDWYPADTRQGGIVIELKLTRGKTHE